MIIATFTETERVGQDISYDGVRGFAIHGRDVSARQVLELDRRGYLEWTSEQSRQMTAAIAQLEGSDPRSGDRPPRRRLGGLDRVFGDLMGRSSPDGTSSNSVDGLAPASDAGDSAPGSQRRPLTRRLILEEALAIIDADGLDALTMRALSARLGYSDMALYKYVANRDQVLDGVVDLLVSHTTLPEGDDSAWETRLSLFFLSIFALHRAHPRTLPAIMLRRPLNHPSVLGGVKDSVAMLVGAGFAEQEAAVALSTLSAYTLGFAALHCSGFFTNAPAAAPDHTRARGSRPDSCTGLSSAPDWEQLSASFEAGLALVLGGLRGAHERLTHADVAPECDTREGATGESLAQ